MKKTLKCGIIGLSMGIFHLDAVLNNGAEIGAICDVNPETLKKVGDKYNVPEEKRFTDWKELLKIEELDIIQIVTPDQLHREISEAALAAGKHVLCEKPIALTREDIEAIIKAAESSDKKFMVGQVMRLNPAKAKITEMALSGEIGEIYYVESEYAHDYATILHGWRADPLRHGVVGGGCHAVDLLRHIAGDPLEVFAYGSHKMLPTVEYDDTTVAVLKYPNGVIGRIFVSTGCKRTYTSRTLIYGTKGTIIWDDNAPTDIILHHVDKDGVYLEKPTQIIKVDPSHHNITKELEILIDHIENDTPVKMSAREGAKTAAVCFAIIESAKTGKPVVPNYEF